MGPFIYSNSGHTAYGVKEYICDTNADVDLLPLDDTPGSSALVIDSGDLYILNSKHEWKQQGGGSSSGGGDTTALENKIKELEKTIESLTKQVSELNTTNQELTQKVQELEDQIAELEKKEDVVIKEDTNTVILPEATTTVNEEIGAMSFNEENTEVREDGTFVLK